MLLCEVQTKRYVTATEIIILLIILVTSENSDSCLKTITEAQLKHF